MGAGKEGGRNYQTFRDQSSSGAVAAQQSFLTVDHTVRNTSVSKNANASDVTANLQKTTEDLPMAKAPAPIGRG